VQPNGAVAAHQEGLRPELIVLVVLEADAARARSGDDCVRCPRVAEAVGSEPDDDRSVKDPRRCGRAGAGRRQSGGASALRVADDRVVEELAPANEPLRDGCPESAAGQLQRQALKALLLV